MTLRRIAIAIAIIALGCSSFINDQAARSTYRIVAMSMDAAKREPDVELARAALPGGLLQLEAFALAYPGHPDFRRLHTESLCQFAVGFVFDDWEAATLESREADAERLVARLRPLLSRCVEANLARLPATWRAAREDGSAATIALVGSATREHVPALLWLASADAVRLAVEPFAHVSELPAILALLRRCAELSPGFRDAEAEVLLATLAAAVGGEDLFPRARQVAGDGALIVETMFARTVAVARKDRSLFETTLQRVLEADPARWPDRRLGNELARRKARRYLVATATLFPEAS